MNIGDFRVEQLSEGVFEVSSAGSIQKLRDFRRQNDSGPVTQVGLDPVLVDTGTTRVLLDAGLGIGLDNSESDPDTSNIITNLDVFGYRATDIQHVILSHLHYDHTAGLSYTDRAGNISATLPNATIHVQKNEWETALQSLELSSKAQGLGYEPDDLYRLVADGRFSFLDSERKEIIKGITVIRTGGHTPGHQVVRIRSGREIAYYCGDLIPNESHLNHYAMNKVDIDSSKARKAKMLLMQQAYRDQATLLFYHSVYRKAGKVLRDENRKFILKQG